MNSSGSGLSFRSQAGLLFLLLAALITLGADSLPVAAAELERDLRSEMLIDADHFKLRLPEVKTLQEWEARKEVLRQKYLLSCGLWPQPEKCALNARIFDERRGKGFRVAKVYFESLPGYLATGNLYRPAEGNGPFPAVICPHGHWRYGRLTNTEKGSLPGRYIDFARMGFVVLSIDMVGFNDCFQLPHDPYKSLAQLKADKPLPWEPRRYRADFNFPIAELYGLSLGGLQVWNCIRAVDFLCSLPEVDTTRIGATGASGGASQTISLMVLDPRIKVAAPVNIIGAAKHPGCRCENMPGLWVDASTIECAATFAPRPLILISATEDPWTNSFPTREMPIFKKYYSLYGAEDMVKNVHIEGGHNYNAASRAAVYEWFCKHLKAPGKPIRNPAPVAPEMKELGDLRVFPDKILPENAISGLEVISNWKAESEKLFQVNLPRSAADLDEFAATFGKALSLLLHLDHPEPDEIISRKAGTRALGGLSHEKLLIGRRGKGDCVNLEIVSAGRASKGTLVLVRPAERGGVFMPGGGGFKPSFKTLAVKDYRICRVGGYASGELSIPKKIWDSYSWPRAYNRSNQLNGIQDILTTLYYVKKTWPDDRITLAGVGRCGLLTAFAGAVFGGADRVLIDLNGTDPGYDGELVSLLPVGSIKRVGDFRTAAILLMRNKLTLINASPTFDGDWYKKQAALLGLEANLELRLDEKVSWVVDLL